MQKKTIIISSIIILTAILLLILTYVIVQSSKGDKDNLLTLASFDGASKKSREGNLVNWENPNGVVVIKNIFSGYPAQIENNIPVRINLYSSEEYEITYEYNGDYFNVVLLDMGYSKTRLEAESKLKEILGVDNTNFCRLPIEFYRAIDLEKMYRPGEALNFNASFCEDSIPLDEQFNEEVTTSSFR